MISKAKWRKEFKKYKNKPVTLHLESGVIFKNSILLFAGENMLGQSVITTKGGGLFHIGNWNNIKIEKV